MSVTRVTPAQRRATRFYRWKLGQMSGSLYPFHPDCAFQVSRKEVERWLKRLPANAVVLIDRRWHMRAGIRARYAILTWHRKEKGA